jgi:hypothetical protein
MSGFAYRVVVAVWRGPDGILIEPIVRRMYRERHESG